MKRLLNIIFIGVYTGTYSILASADALTPLERRNTILKIAVTKPADGIGLLTKALKDKNMLVRRAAIRSLSEFGKSAENALIQGFHNSDPVVRGISLTELYELGLIKNDFLVTALQDKDVRVRKRAMDIIRTMKPYPKEIVAVLQKGMVRNSTDEFPFYRDAPLLADRVDNVILTFKRIPLPLKGWKLKEDPKNIGLKEKWYDPGYREQNWNPVEIAKFWGEFG